MVQVWIICTGTVVCVEENIKSVAFPYMIGCGLAGGNWETYLGMITDFQKTYADVSVVIYKLP